MTFIPQGLGAGGAGGTGVGGGPASVYSAIQQASDDALGVEVGIVGNRSWSLQGRQRALTTTQATADLPIRDNIALRLTIPINFGRPGAQGNGFGLRIRGGTAAVPAVPATYASGTLTRGGTGGGIRFTFAGDRPNVQGVEGNDWFFDVTRSGPGITLTVNPNSERIDLDFTNSATLAQVKAAFDNFNSDNITFTTEYIDGATGTENFNSVSVTQSGMNGGTDGTAAVPRSAFISSNISLGLQDDEYGFTVWAVSGDTLDDLIAGIAATTIEGYLTAPATFAFGAANVGKANASDSGATTVNPALWSSTFAARFAGGAPPEPITIESDEAALTLTVKYDAPSDHPTDIRDALIAEGFLSGLIFGTSESATLETPPFTRGFTRAGAGAIATAAAARAEAARDRAITAETDAETAETGAQTAETGANAADIRAGDAEVAARNSSTTADLARVASQTARDASEGFRDESEGFRDEAEQFATTTQDIAVGSPKGDIWATTPVLSTATRSVSSEYPFAAAVGWDVTAEGLAAGFGDPADGEENLPLPNLAPPGTNGYWFQVLVGNDVVGEVMYPFGQRYGSRTFPTIARIFAGLDSSDDPQWVQADYRDGEVSIYGGGTTLSTNTRVRIRAAVVRGEAGSGTGTGGSDSASQILTKLLTVDGAGSGLDADLLDGMTPAQVAALASGGGFTLRFGADVPAAALGADGDWYIATDTGGFYSRASGAWVLRYTDQAGTGGGLTIAQVNALIAAGITDTALAADAATESTTVAASRQAIAEALALKASLAGATFTGAVEIGSSSGGPLTVQGENAGNDTIMKIFTPATGTQKAFGAGREGEFDFVQFAGEVVTGKPGFALGPGTARDTNLYREEADHLRTDDEFSADELSVHGTLSDTQANLGILTQAQVDARAAVRYTDGEKSKLAAIEGGATADQTGAEVVSLLEALSGSGRLAGSAIKLLADAIDTELGNNTWRTGGGTGFTLRTGAGIPAVALGDNGDWYLRTSNGQWYEKVSGAWVSRYTDQVGQMGSGLTQAEVDARIQTALAAAVTGNTETGITVTYNSDGTIDFVTGPPAQTHLNYIAISADNAFTPAEFTGAATGDNSMSTSLVVPTFDGVSRFIAIAVPDAQNDITDITQSGVSTFGSWVRIAGTIVIGGEAHKVWRTTDTQNDLASGITYVIVQ